jgi:DNA topoisomerase-1
LSGNAIDTAPIVVRVGRYGPFIERAEQRASLPEDLAPDELTFQYAEELLAKQQISEEPLGMHPELLKPIYIKQGRFGPYVQLGAPEDEEKKNASLLKGMSVETLDLETAVKLLSLPRDLGKHPTDGEPVIATQGRFGPFLKHGSDSRSLPAGIGLLEITLEQALEILAQPKAAGRGRGVATPPLKTMEESPVTGKKIELRDGRYGLYVTDGETNASLPKDANGDELTFAQALDLLAARAAAGGSKKKKTSKKKTAKKATKASKVSKKAADDEGVATPKKAAKKKAAKAAKKATKKATKKKASSEASEEAE